MGKDWTFGLKQKFNIKCAIDLGVFVLTCILFLVFSKFNNIAPYDAVMFIVTVSVINILSLINMIMKIF